jgi:hypothetical protein
MNINNLNHSCVLQHPSRLQVLPPALAATLSLMLARVTFFSLSSWAVGITFNLNASDTIYYALDLFIEAEAMTLPFLA